MPDDVSDAVSDALGRPHGRCLDGVMPPADAEAHAVAGDPSAGGFEALFEDAPCGFLCVSPDWRIERANATFAEWTGHGAAALEGRAFVELLDIAGKIYVGTHFAPLLRLQGKFDEVALNVVRADGSKMPVLVNARERRDADGRLRMVLASVFNATDRRRYESELLDARNALGEANETLERRVEKAVAERIRVEEALAHAQRMEAIGNLSAGIAHDFNNLLQVIGGNLQLLRKHVPSDAGQARIERAAGGIERGARLAGQLLAFGRRQTLDARVQDLGAAVRKLADSLIGTLGGEVELSVEVPASPADAPDARRLRASVDPALLENAVINLAVNARDAMRGPDGLATGTITLGAARERIEDARQGTAAGSVPAGDYVVVTVADTGSGMAPDVASKVFEPFFTTKAPGEGTGLGLSMVYGFVAQSGGHVTIDSVPDRGTTIRLWLPHAKRGIEAERGGEGNARADRLPPAHGQGTVLVVEDDDAVLEVACDLLADLGYKVLTARNGTNALSVLDAHGPIDLVLADMVMPGPVRGKALAALALERQPATALLFTTGYAEMAALSELRDEGHAILRKPFTREALADAVRRALDGRATGAGTAASPDGGDVERGHAAGREREPAGDGHRSGGRSGTGSPGPAPSTESRSTARPGPRVLLVEDEGLIRMDAVEMLEDLGCRVEEAASAARALSLLEAERFDVLITDVELGDALGTDLARKARAIDPGLRIVFATGRDGVEEAADFGARVLRKPYDMGSLRSAIEPDGPKAT